MFSTKKTSLFDVKTKKSSSASSKTTGSKNGFIQGNLKNAAITSSGNGSLKYSTSGSDFLDQFGSISHYREIRSFEKISNDMSLLYSIDKEKAIALTLYIRLVTRTVSYFDGSKTEEVQKGQGLRHEAICRMLWLAINDSKAFWENVHLFISAGSWKDVFTMLSYDLQYHGWEGKKLDWKQFGSLVISGLENENTSNLVKKYLPQIKAKSKCTTLGSQADTIIGKYICSQLFGNKLEDVKGLHYRSYRKLKVSGSAHEWQQLISKKLLKDINFGTVHGRALSLLVGSKFITNNGLEDIYTEWIEKQPVAKYTGYVYELLSHVKNGYSNVNLKPYQVHTINKQFMGLVELGKKNINTETKFICALDTSSSMTSNVNGLNYNAYDVAKSVALYFSYLLEGEFSKYFFEFNDNAALKEWKGNTPVERIQNDRSEAYGSTNFLGISKSFVAMKRKGIPESEFPTGIIAISDGEFNSGRCNKTSNVDQFKDALSREGFSKDFVDNFTFVFWDIPNDYYGSSDNAKFETFGDHTNVFYMSGFDPSGISFLLGGSGINSKESPVAIPKDAMELMEAALSQEIMTKIKIS